MKRCVKKKRKKKYCYKIQAKDFVTLWKENLPEGDQTKPRQMCARPQTQSKFKINQSNPKLEIIRVIKIQTVQAVRSGAATTTAAAAGRRRWSGAAGQKGPLSGRLQRQFVKAAAAAELRPTHPEVVESGGGEALPRYILGQGLQHAWLLNSYIVKIF
jgi:hypothetical protein